MISSFSYDVWKLRSDLDENMPPRDDEPLTYCPQERWCSKVFAGLIWAGWEPKAAEVEALRRWKARGK